MALVINGKEYGLLYTVEAYLDYQDYLLNNPDVNLYRGSMQLACFMNREYNKANGIKGKGLRMEDMYTLKKGDLDLDAIVSEVDIQIKVDSETTVSVKPGKEEAVKES